MSYDFDNSGYLLSTARKSLSYILGVYNDHIRKVKEATLVLFGLSENVNTNTKMIKKLSDYRSNLRNGVKDQCGRIRKNTKRVNLTE